MIQTADSAQFVKENTIAIGLLEKLHAMFANDNLIVNKYLNLVSEIDIQKAYSLT